jgi:hypothetical protein
MKSSKMLVLFMMVLLVSTIVSAYMPDTHIKMLQDACKEYPNHMVCKSEENLVACANGDLSADFSVPFYFQGGGKRYGITHAIGYCTALLDISVDELDQVFAFCSCTHLVQDSPSHNVMVPYAIKHTGLPNAIVHVLSEEKLNDWVRSRDPTIEAFTKTNLDFIPYAHLIEEALATNSAYYGVSIREYLTLLQSQIAGSSTGYDTVWENKFSVPLPTYIGAAIIIISLLAIFIRLLFLVDKNFFGWITVGLTGTIGILVLILFIGFSVADFGFTLFQDISKPLTAITPTPPLEQMYELGVENTKDLLRNFNDLEDIVAREGIATGFNNIDRANKFPLTLWSIIGSIGLISVIIFGFRHFTDRKNFWEYFQRF